MSNVAKNTRVSSSSHKLWRLIHYKSKSVVEKRRHFEHVEDGYTWRRAHLTLCRRQPFQVLANLLYPTIIAITPWSMECWSFCEGVCWMSFPVEWHLVGSSLNAMPSVIWHDVLPLSLERPGRKIKSCFEWRQLKSDRFKTPKLQDLCKP